MLPPSAKIFSEGVEGLFIGRRPLEACACVLRSPARPGLWLKIARPGRQLGSAVHVGNQVLSMEVRQCGVFGIFRPGLHLGLRGVSGELVGSLWGASRELPGSFREPPGSCRELPGSVHEPPGSVQEPPGSLR